MKNHLKIVLLGDSSVGKTSLLADKYYSENIEPNLETNFMTKDITIEDKVLSIEFWDMPGRRSLRYRSVPYYRGADCCVLVYDVTSLKSFESLDYWRNEFLAEIATPNNGQWFPFVVIGNKIDLNDRMVNQEYARSWSRDMEVLSYFETSAKDSTNVQEAFQKIVKYALDFNQKNTIQIDHHEHEVRPCCCGLFSFINLF